MKGKREIKHLLKKSAAIASASVMIFSLPVTASAEGTAYSDREKAALKAAGEFMAADWDKSLETDLTETGAIDSDAVMDINLTIDESGRSMLGMLMGMDVSWLENIVLHMDASVADSKEAVRMSALVNDSTICNIYTLIDFINSAEYIQIPELSSSYLKASLEAEGMESTSAYMEAMSAMLSDPASVLPEGAVLGEILERYGNIIIDHMQEGASVEESISIDGIGEDCTLLEGQIPADDVDAIAREILTTAQTDEQIREILTKCSEADPEGGDLNEKFQSFLDETFEKLDALADEVEEDTSNKYIASRIWVNAEDRIVGREIAFCEGVNEDAVITWKNPKDGDHTGLLLDMQSDGSEFAITGSGQNTDGTLNGTYHFITDGITVMDIAVENLSSNANGEGYPAGIFTVTFPSGETEEDYNPLSMFSLTADLTSSSADESIDLKLTLLSSGASLCSLNFHIANGGDGVEAVAEENMGTIYDMTSEEDMNSYEFEMAFDTIFENAENAGIPAEILYMIEDSMLESEIIVTEEYTDVPADDAA